MVTDPTGAAAANAQVELQANASAVSKTTRTGPAPFDRVPRGSYDVLVTFEGFQPDHVTFGDWRAGPHLDGRRRHMCISPTCVSLLARARTAFNARSTRASARVSSASGPIMRAWMAT